MPLWRTASSNGLCQPFLPRRLWNECLTEIPLISIVDDDEAVCAATGSLVRSLGFATRAFLSAESFLRSSAVSETQCLILDVQMPNMSGVELQSHLSSLGFDIPIIFMTAFPDEAVRARVLDGGAVDFLHKREMHGQRFIDSLHAALERRKRSAL